MGQTNTIEDREIYNSKTGQLDQRKKINPLKYIQPIHFQTEDLMTCNFDVGLSKKLVDQNKENVEIFEEDAESLEQVQDVIECMDGEEKITEEKISNIVKVKWNKFIKMKNRNFQEDYRIMS